eukprot:1034574-Amphidinium_carterae.1
MEDRHPEKLRKYGILATTNSPPANPPPRTSNQKHLEEAYQEGAKLTYLFKLKRNSNPRVLADMDNGK